MKGTLCLNEKFTFHGSWLTAMGYIASKAARNRLMASIVEYGLNGRHVPVGNSTADAILSIVMDQIDREGGRRTRREDHAGCGRPYQGQEAARHDVQPDGECRGDHNECGAGGYGGASADSVADGSGVVGDGEAVTEQKQAEDCLPEKIPVEEGAAVRGRLPGRTVRKWLHLSVRHKNKSGPKKNGPRTRRRRRR